MKRSQPTDRATAAELPGDPLAAIRYLRMVRDLLAQAAPESAGAFATMLANYEATGGAEPLDRAFRLVPACGQRGWASAERHLLRDAALVEAWRRFYAALKPTGAAAVLARDLGRMGRVESKPSDPRSQLLAEICNHNGGQALGKRQIFSILRREKLDRAMKGGPLLHTFSLHADATKL